MESCLEVYSFAQLHYDDESVTWNSLLGAATDFVREHATEIISSPDILYLNSSLLAKVGPIVLYISFSQSVTDLAAPKSHRY